MSAEELQAHLHTRIPLSAAMAVQVAEASEGRVRLRAPLEPNLNHRGTAFGGSIATLAILAGWALAYLRLQAHGFTGRLVIQREAVEYRQPVPGAFEARCDAPGSDAWDALLVPLARRGRGRITLTATVYADEAVAATFTGTYVALAS